MTTNENRIKELETELERLKRETELSKRLEHIEQKYIEREQKADDEFENLKVEYATLRCTISSMENDMYNIITIANAMKNRGFKPMEVWKGANSSYGCVGDTIGLARTYTTDPYDKIVFTDYNYYRIDCRLTDNDEIEIEDIYNSKSNGADRNAKISYLKTAISTLRYFIEHFPEFKNKFYEKVDNL